MNTISTQTQDLIRIANYITKLAECLETNSFKTFEIPSDFRISFGEFKNKTEQQVIEWEWRLIAGVSEEWKEVFDLVSNELFDLPEDINQRLIKAASIRKIEINS